MDMIDIKSYEPYKSKECLYNENYLERTRTRLSALIGVYWPCAHSSFLLHTLLRALANDVAILITYLFRMSQHNVVLDIFSTVLFSLASLYNYIML